MSAAYSAEAASAVRRSLDVVCSCGHYLEACSLCGRAAPSSHGLTRLELLAGEADVDVWQPRRHLRRRVSEAHVRRLLGASPSRTAVANDARVASVPWAAWEATGGDALLAIDVALNVR